MEQQQQQPSRYPPMTVPASCLNPPPCVQPATTQAPSAPPTMNPSSSVQATVTTAPPPPHPEEDADFYDEGTASGSSSYLVQFHDIWVVRNSVMAVKCDFSTGAVKFVFFGGGNESLSTQVPPERLREALRAFSAGKDFELTPELAQAEKQTNPEKPETKQAGAPPAGKTQVEYSVGDKVVALDIQRNWWLGAILDRRGAGRYLVGFDGCSAQFNEVLDFNSIRARLPERIALSDVNTHVTVLYMKKDSKYKCYVGVTSSEDASRDWKCVVAYL